MEEIQSCYIIVLQYDPLANRKCSDSDAEVQGSKRNTQRKISSQIHYVNLNRSADPPLGTPARHLPSLVGQNSGTARCPAGHTRWHD